MAKRIPKFKSEEEKARFWSKNSPLDYLDQFVEEKEPFKFALSLLEKAAEKHKERKTSLTLRMEESLILLAKIIAKKHNDHYQALMRKWIRQEILKELKQDSSIEKEMHKQHLHLLGA